MNTREFLEWDAEQLIHGIVPAHFSLVHEHADERRREGLGGRADSENGLRCHRRFFFDVCQAEALCQNDRIVFDHGDGHTGDMLSLTLLLKLFHQLFHQAVQPLLQRYRCRSGGL